MNEYLDTDICYDFSSNGNFIRFLSQIYLYKYLKKMELLPEKLAYTLKNNLIPLHYNQYGIEIYEYHYYEQFLISIFESYAYTISYTFFNEDETENKKLVELLPQEVSKQLVVKYINEYTFLTVIKNSKITNFYNYLRKYPLIYDKDILNIIEQIRLVQYSFPHQELIQVNYVDTYYMVNLGSMENPESCPDNVNYSVIYTLVDLDNNLTNFLAKISYH
ncbi:hypothetical protein [Vallitalea guaymasensis]|uniref:hypothetical protein n=1 Tax=Vallitalea guaymasensis TaxID=1185412 RepID=UPI000DE1CBDC|nr:hypothetical protein [Vallitalea guaymasensis]